MPYDILFTVPSLPPAGGKVDASSLHTHGGGPVPGVMVGLTRLGLKCAVIAAVGDDLAGKEMRKELLRENISSKYLVSKKGSSDAALGFVEEGSGRRTISLYRGASVKPTDLKLKEYPVPKLIHLDGRDLEACIKLARWGKKHRSIITFDIGSIRNDVSPIFPFVDHLIVADSFAFPYTGAKNATDAITALRRLCLGTVVVTKGVTGATGCENDSFVRHPAYIVETVDTTGAGDAFHTGYIFGLLNNQPLAERLKLGSAVAAIKCMKPGARTGLPTATALNKFLKNAPVTYV